MTPSAAISRRFLQFAAVALLTTASFAQAPPKYDRATETKIKVTVEELKIIPPGGAKSVAYLVSQGPNNDAVEIFLCPKKFLDDIGVTFKADDAIEVTGSKVKQDGEDMILAREVVKNGETLTFRFQDGRPAW